MNAQQTDELRNFGGSVMDTTPISIEVNEAELDVLRQWRALSVWGKCSVLGALGIAKRKDDRHTRAALTAMGVA